MKYQFTDFEIDTELFEISSGKDKITTEPKVFDLIVYLLKNRDRVISRNELFEQVWEGREVVDTSLSNHVKSARKVLGDNGDLQQVIKTIRGRGYQFVATVTEVHQSPDKQQLPDPSLHPLPADSDIADKSDSTSLGKTSKVTLTLCLSLLLLAAYFFFGQEPKLADSQQQPYILVTPFQVSAGNNDKWSPFADQITREVILKMRKISGLRVVPASSAFTFKQDRTRKYIQAQLPEVNYVLNATVSVSVQSDIQISAALENLRDETIIWDNKYLSRIDQTNLFSVQGEIASAVAESLKVLVPKAERQALGRLPTSNLQAYELYVAGQQQLNLLTHASLERSITLFDQAIELDNTFSAAYISKANAFRIIMTYFEIPADALPNVIDSVAASLALNPESAHARSALGLAYVFAWRWEDAWSMLNEARDADPNLALTELGFALYYSALGDVENVYRSLEKANQLDPLNIELADWGHWALAMTGEIEAAQKWGEDKTRLHPDVGLVFSGASVSASLSGQHQKAISLAQKGVELDYGSPYSLLALAQTYGFAGQKNKVQPLLNEALQSANYMCPYEAAVVYLLIDDVEEVFNQFNRAVSSRSNCLIFTRNDPRLIPLHTDPRFEALLTRIGLDDESIRTYAGYNY